MIAWLLLLLVAFGDDRLLVPRREDFDRSLARVTELLDQARVFQDQMALVQSRFVAEGCAVGTCPIERAAQLVVDAQYAGSASRDLLQSARAEFERTSLFALAPTVAPLLDDTRRGGMEQLKTRVERAVRAWLVRSAWYEQRMAPWAVRYKATVARTCARPPGQEEEAP